MKTFEEFIKETYWRDLTEHNILSFQETIEEVFLRGDSYSELCKKEDAIPEKDYEKMQKAMDLHGWSIDKIKNFVKTEMDNNENKLLDYIQTFNLDDLNGEIDYYLYKTFQILGFNKDLIKLGGDGWDDIHITEDEALIRYSYGYHKTEYGKLFMEQAGITEKELSMLAASYLLEEMVTSAQYDLYRKLSKTHTNFEIKMKDFYIKEEDRLIIFTGELSDYILKEKKEKIEKEKIDAYFTQQTDDYPIEIIQTQDELVIYLGEKE